MTSSPRRFIIARLGALVLLPFVLMPVGASAQLRIVAYNTKTAFNSNGTPNPGLQTVLQGMGNESVNGFAGRAAILGLTEQNNNTGSTTLQILNMMNALYGAGTYAKGNLISDGTVDPNTDSSAVVYDTTKVSLINEVLVGTASVNGMPRQEIRYQFRPVGYGSSADFYVYVGHWKAGGEIADQQRRTVEAQTLRANVNTLAAGSRVLYSGDMNITEGAGETAWQTMLAAGNGQASDPFNSSWAGAARTWSTTNMGSRLDFILNTAPTNDGRGFSLMSGGYRTFGNNGSTPTGGAANSGANTALPGLPNRAAVLQALTTASDHYPVVGDYRIPARMGVSVAGVPATVIEGASVPVNVTVTNTAPVTVAAGADGLDYTVSGSGSLTGSGAGTMLMALAPGNVHALNLNTSSPGVRSGNVSVTSTSQEVANGSFSQPVSTTVLAHANPSFDIGSDVNVATIDFGIKGRGLLGSATQSFSLANLAHVSGFTARLDLDSISGAGDTGALSTTAAPFTNLPAGSTVSFDAALSDANLGTFAATYTLNLSDENLPGAALVGPLTLHLAAIVAIPGDADLNGLVDGDDYAHIDFGFNTGATGWENGDFDGNGVIDGDDYALIDFSFNTQRPGALGSIDRAMDYLSGDDRSLNGMNTPELRNVVKHFNEFGVPYAQLFMSTVPEPGVVTLLIAVAPLLRRRRRG
jgi:hypothetical protein